jgi:hypothetical protein
MQNATDTTLRWVTVITIPYGAYPGEVQGVSGTAGPGSRANLGNFQLDPLGKLGIVPGGVFNDEMKFVPSDGAAGFNQLYLQLAWTVEEQMEFLLKGGTSGPDPGPRIGFQLGQRTPDEIAGISEWWAENMRHGTCATAALISAWLGPINGYGAVVWNISQFADTGSGFTPVSAPAVTQLFDGTTSPVLNGGKLTTLDGAASSVGYGGSFTGATWNGSSTYGNNYGTGTQWNSTQYTAYGGFVPFFQYMETFTGWWLDSPVFH